jgi:hypothetical protein
MSRQVRGLLIGAGLVVLTTSSVSPKNPPVSAPVTVGLPAPNLTITTTNGRSIQLTGLLGNVVLVSFWASW